jgi:tRNA(adenine34) deaminase
VQPGRDQAHLSADEAFLRAALREAEQAEREDEVPVGAVIVHDGRIIGRGHNQREMLTDPTAHAEMIAITQAAAALESWRLEKTTLFVTLEPCLMCAGAIVNARIPRVVFGVKDPKAGACGSLYQVGLDARLNHRFDLVGGVLEKECGAILQRFFQRKRPV